MLRTLTITLAIITGAGVPQASAQMSPLGLAIALRACQQITEDAARLKCFDKITSAVPSTDDVPTAPGKWIVSTRTSPVDDTKSTTASLLNNEERGNRVAFGFACRDGDLSTWFAAEGKYFARDAAVITYRLDREEPKTITMTPSSNRRAYGLWNRTDALLFLFEAEGKSTLAIRINEPAGDRTEAVFDITGLPATLKTAGKDCME